MDRLSAIAQMEYEIVKDDFNEATDFAMKIAEKYKLDISHGSPFTMKHSFGSSPVIKKSYNQHDRSAIMIATAAVVWDKSKIVLCSFQPVHTMEAVDDCMCKLSEKIKLAENQLKIIELEKDFKE